MEYAAIAVALIAVFVAGYACGIRKRLSNLRVGEDGKIYADPMPSKKPAIIVDTRDPLDIDLGDKQNE